MYVIKKINVDDKLYLSSQLIDYTNKQIVFAIGLLERAILSYVKTEFGNQNGNIKILDIHDFNQINEPLIDSILLYRLFDDPHRIHIYQKRTELIDLNGWFSVSKSTASSFRRIAIFELEEYDIVLPNQSEAENVIKIEMVPPPFGPPNLKIPKAMTVAPICDFIDELKKSTKFKSRFVPPHDSNEK